MVSGASFPSVHPLGKIFLYVAAVLLSGALAAPQAWNLIHLLPADLFHGFAGQVQGMPFHRYFSRSLQVSAIILLLPLLRSLRIRSLREFGLLPNPRPWKDLGIGLIAGCFCMGLLMPLLLGFGFYVPKPEAFSLMTHALPRILSTAVAVALLEEFLFRGVLLGFFRQVMLAPVAVIASALIFASVHFLHFSSPSSADLAPSWWSGFEMFGGIGRSLPPFGIFFWAFSTLFVAGLILGWLTVRTASLYPSIGLHAIWILGQQLFNKGALYQVTPPGGLLPLIGPSQCSGMVPVGILPLLCLILAGSLAILLLRKRARPPEFI